MILQREILDRSNEWNVPPDTVDKDWVLGHFLAAFYTQNNHLKSLIFKGGTCLRKCYFPRYRFSEDLDFTSVEVEYVLTEDILAEAIETASTHSEIRFYILPIRKMFYNDKPTGYQVKIMYWGANHRKDTPPPDNPVRWHHSIKLEITTYEILVQNPSLRNIYHPFSDQLLNPEGKIPCYNLREIMAEKLRSLLQRSYTAARNIYATFPC